MPLEAASHSSTAPPRPRWPLEPRHAASPHSILDHSNCPAVMQLETSRTSEAEAALPSNALPPSSLPPWAPDRSAPFRAAAPSHARYSDGRQPARTLTVDTAMTASTRAPHEEPSPPSLPLHQRCGSLSLQSSVHALTPPLSGVHTPLTGRGAVCADMGGLAQFTSAPATPRANRRVAVTVAKDTPLADHAGAVDTSVEGAVQLPVGDGKPPSYGTSSSGDRKGSTQAEGDEGGGPDEGDDPAREQSALEFNSFAALEASFMSNASSQGGGHGGARTYNTLGKAAFHIFKGNVGAGVFLLPTYYQDSGYVLGVLCVALLGLLMMDCSLALLHAKHAINRAEVKTYPAVVGFVLGSWFRYFTDFGLIFTQFGFCVMYVQYASSIFASITDFPNAYAVWIVITVLAVTPMTFLSNRMNLLAYASMLAAIFVAVVLAGTTVVDVQNLTTKGIAPGVVAFLPSARILVFLSGHMFSLEGIGIVLPVENSLEPSQRGRFGVVVKYTLLCIVSLYIVFGVLGYAAYGATLHTSVVLALPKSLTKTTLQLLLGLSLIFGYPIQYVPAIQLVDRAIGVSIRRNRAKAYQVRIALNILFGVLALFIGGDALNIFASFLGAFAGVHLMITIPSLLALQLECALDPNRDSLTYAQYMAKMVTTPVTLQRARCYAYLALALVVWIGGLYFTVDSVFRGVPAPREDSDSAPVS